MAKIATPVIPLLVLLCLAIGATAGFLDAIQCPGKVQEECSSFERTDKDDNTKRVQCCAWAQYTRCIESSAEKHCPGTPIAGILSTLNKIDAGACGEEYTYWSLQCLYTNYLLVLIGSTVGLVAVIVVLVVICCCCCRKK